MDMISKSAAATAAAVGLAGAAAYTWASADPEGYVINTADLEQQSIEHPDIPACRKSKYTQDTSDEGTMTLHELFEEAVEKYGDRKCLGCRSSPETGFDTWLTYSEVSERSTNVGYGLRWLGLQPTNQTFVGMFSKNRVEMVLTQLACYQHSMVIVPMYDTLGDEGIEHIVNQTKMEVIVCDDEDKVKHLVKWGAGKLPNVTTIVLMNAADEETIRDVAEQGWKMFSFSEMESKGENNPVEKHLCKLHDLCVVCYTSGTTGKPKGAMMEHKAVFCVLDNAKNAMVRELKDGVNFFKDDESYLSYLPLAHLYEQCMLVLALRIGARIGFYSGDVKELLNDIKYMQPTIFASVPRLLNRIYDKIMGAVSQSKVKSWLFHTALAKKEVYFKRGIITKATIWDRLVFKKIQDLLGGRVKSIITGAAPISPPVLRFLRLAFGSAVVEGYGQTESTAAMSFSVVGEYGFGEVGPPAPYNMIKLVDVPEMNYYAADNVGEVCGYGANVFRGYLFDEARTRDTIDSDGWLHTGDIGTWTERGTLKIIDRKKNIFKLSQGEYIAPEKIENVYVNCPLVAQCFVHGESLQSCLVAIVVPDADVLPTYATSELGIAATDMTELCRNEKVKAAIMKGMAKCAKDFNLKGFEQAKDVHLTAEPFSVENDLLTPTFKLKRMQSRTKYQKILEEMYNNM